MHTSRDNPDNSDNNFTLTPAVGTLVPVSSRFKLRGDLRDVVLFATTTNNLVAELGLTIGV